MANVPNCVETLPKISIVWVGRTNVTDRRQTDRWAITYSESERSRSLKTMKEKSAAGVLYRACLIIEVTMCNFVFTRVIDSWVLGHDIRGALVFSWDKLIWIASPSGWADVVWSDRRTWWESDERHSCLWLFGCEQSAGRRVQPQRWCTLYVDGSRRSELIDEKLHCSETLRHFYTTTQVDATWRN